MAKKTLDLSRTLSPLANELHDLLIDLLALKQEDSPLFDGAIEDFINKYGGSPYESLDELLQSSAAAATYAAPSETVPLGDLLKDLLAD